VKNPYFPPDVSLRIEGDLADARPFLGLARATLQQALNMREASGVQVGQLTRKAGDSGYVRVLLNGPIKIVWISTGRGPVDTTTDEASRKENRPERYVADMIHGWVDTGTIVTDEEGVEYLAQYRPTLACWLAHRDNGMPRDFHNNSKLPVPPAPHITGGGATQYVWLKPGMYSGTMKRVVQALFGVGLVTDDSNEYTTGEQPDEIRRIIDVEYDYKWARTHGIYKAGDQNHWLVEISFARGVLAMPLPLFPRTKSAGYRERARSAGDTDTVAILDEFGGIPSGEMFPTGAELEDLITEGKVLRLLTADELDDFYGDDAAALYDAHGWAFSESGVGATNVMYRYEAHAPRFYHYVLDIDLNQHDITLPPANPVGAGTAQLRMITRGWSVMDMDDHDALGFAATFRVPVLGTDEYATLTIEPEDEHGTHIDYISHLADPSLYVPTFMAFYVGEELEVLRGKHWLPSIIAGPLETPELVGSIVDTFTTRPMLYSNSLDIRRYYQQSTGTVGPIMGGGGVSPPDATLYPAYACGYIYGWTYPSGVIFPHGCREGFLLMAERVSGSYSTEIYDRGGSFIGDFIRTIQDPGQISTSYFAGFYAQLGRADPAPGIRGLPGAHVQNWYEDPDINIRFDITFNTNGDEEFVSYLRVHHENDPNGDDPLYERVGNMRSLEELTTRTVNWVGHIS
jgi:hypothetical protein